MSYLCMLDSKLHYHDYMATKVRGRIESKELLLIVVNSYKTCKSLNGFPFFGSNTLFYLTVPIYGPPKGLKLIDNVKNTIEFTDKSQSKKISILRPHLSAQVDICFPYNHKTRGTPTRDMSSSEGASNSYYLVIRYFCNITY